MRCFLIYEDIKINIDIYLALFILLVQLLKPLCIFLAFAQLHTFVHRFLYLLYVLFPLLLCLVSIILQDSAQELFLLRHSSALIAPYASFLQETIKCSNYLFTFYLHQTRGSSKTDTLSNSFISQYLVQYFTLMKLLTNIHFLNKSLLHLIQLDQALYKVLRP